MIRRFLFLATLAVVGSSLLLGCSENGISTFGTADGPVFEPSAPPVGNGALVQGEFPIETRVSIRPRAEGCYNNPGPYITLTGEITLGGLGGRIILRNNTRGTHEADAEVTADLVLVPAGEEIRFNKQPPEGGVGGNPHIWIQFTDENWNPITREATYLGRCVQGLEATGLVHGLPGSAQVEVTSGDCQNSGGPQIVLNGELRLGGINANLIFTNNAKWTHKRSERTEVGVVILPPGRSLTFAKQPPQGGAGGNPLIYFQFLDGNGDPLGGEVFLGRCNRLDR